MRPRPHEFVYAGPACLKIACTDDFSVAYPVFGFTHPHEYATGDLNSFSNY